MANMLPTQPTYQPKSFWQKPEGVTGGIFMAALVAGGAYLLYKFLPFLISIAQNTLYLVAMVAALAALVYIIIDPRMRNLIWYMYKSVMRALTGMFVEIDPIGILKTYVEKLESNLGNMSKQIGVLQGQMSKMRALMDGNNKDIESSMKLAEQAKKQGVDDQVLLQTRKAARLKDSNEKYDVLFKKMELLKKVLSKMYDNSAILLEDTKDQVNVKEQERKAIRTSHSAMKSAMSILSGDPDQRAMFDMAMDNINTDVANKVGEMERFMDMSSNFMKSIDLQNGVFEDDGLKMLEEWEQKSSLLMPNTNKDVVAQESVPLPRSTSDQNNYDNLFK